MTIYDWDHIKKYHPDAKYAAMDEDGQVYSFEYLPTCRLGFWVETSHRYGIIGPYTGAVFAGDRPLNAEESLEEAPE